MKVAGIATGRETMIELVELVVLEPGELGYSSPPPTHYHCPTSRDPPLTGTVTMYM